jgi:hypothetical protein
MASRIHQNIQSFRELSKISNQPQAVQAQKIFFSARVETLEDIKLGLMLSALA